MKKFIALLLLMVFITVPMACNSAGRYNAVLYDSAANWINEEFRSKNRISGAYYDDGQMDDCPETRTFIVSDRENFESIFVEDFKEFEVDFAQEMLIVYTFSIAYVLPAKITKMLLSDETLTIDYSVELIAGTGSMVKPFQRWFVVKLDKLNISTVKFESYYEYTYKK